MLLFSIPLMLLNISFSLSIALLFSASFLVYRSTLELQKEQSQSDNTVHLSTLCHSCWQESNCESSCVGPLFGRTCLARWPKNIKQTCYHLHLCAYTIVWKLPMEKALEQNVQEWFISASLGFLFKDPCLCLWSGSEIVFRQGELCNIYLWDLR